LIQYKNMKKLLVATVVLFLSSASLAQADPSDSSFQINRLSIYGGTSSPEAPIGQPDNNLSLSLDDGQTWGPVYLAGNSSHANGYGFRTGTNSWLNCNPNPNPCPGNAPQIIRSSFNLPDEFYNLQISLDVLIDDVGYFYLNGNQFWVAGIEARNFDLTNFAKPGLNNLDVKVVNVGGEVGINFRYDIQALTNGEINQVQTKFTGSNTSATPTIYGEPISGQTIEARLPSLANGVSVNYQWLRDGEAVSGANTSSFNLSSADIGKMIQIRTDFIPTNPRYPSDSKTSEPVRIEDGSKFQILNILGGKSGSANPMGGPDKYLSISQDDGNSWGPAYISPNSSFLRVYGAIPGTDAWVNARPSEWGPPRQIVQAKFVLPEDYSNLKLKIFATVDNSGEFSINGNQILSCYDASCVNGRDLAISSYARPGLNVIQLKIIDYGWEVGANFKYVLTFNSAEQANLLPAKFNFPAMQNPFVTGSHRPDSTVSASIPNIPTGASTKYEWLRDGNPIVGAQGTSYTITNSDIGKYLSFRLTLSQNAFDDLVVASEPFKVHGLGPELNPENGHYYQFVPFSGNWYEAIRYARTLQFNGIRGHMATVTSSSENRFVTSISDGNVIWLPSRVSVRNGKSHWAWVDGPEYGQAFSLCQGRGNCASVNNSYSQWDEEINQPDMGGEPVLVMRNRASWTFDAGSQRISNGRWADWCINCAQGFVVEFDPNWKTFIDENSVKAGTNHYYQIIRSRLSYEDALIQARNSYFRGIKGHLVTIESTQENALVSLLAAGNSFWVAGRDTGKLSQGQRNWVWDDGPAKGKQFLTCVTYSGCLSENYEFSHWSINMSYLNGYGSWENVIQSGGTDNWETWNDCSGTLEQCPHVNSYIVEYELDSQLTQINAGGDWISLDSNIVLPGQKILVNAHFENPVGLTRLSSSDNRQMILPSHDEYGNSTALVSFAGVGAKSLFLANGKKKFLVQVWVPKVTISRRVVKVGGTFTLTISSVKPGAVCKVALSDGRLLEVIANSSRKATFVISGNSVGILSLAISAGSLALDPQAVTVLR